MWRRQRKGWGCEGWATMSRRDYILRNVGDSGDAYFLLSCIRQFMPYPKAMKQSGVTMATGGEHSSHRRAAFIRESKAGAIIARMESRP